jgi:hypothetical protein
MSLRPHETRAIEGNDPVLLAFAGAVSNKTCALALRSVIAAAAAMKP